MKNTPLHLAEALGHESSDKRIAILQQIGETGSISAAARKASVSYKAAWQAIETLNNLAGTALVEKAVGGAGGGGAILTDAGRQLLYAAARLSEARAAVLTQLEHGPASAGILALGLRTSMRNQLPCKIRRLGMAGASLRVELELADGRALCSRITAESGQLLGLYPGQAVLALCKATAVEIAQQLPAREGFNLVHGQISRTAEAGGGETGLQLAGGLQLVGFAGPAHNLSHGDAAMASVDESGIVLAIAG